MRSPPMHVIKRGLLAAGATLLFLALAWALWPKPVMVEFAELQKGPLVVTVDEEGKTRIKDVYSVSTPITGKLVRLSLEAGDRVQKDATTVAIIEPMAPAFLDVRATRELQAQLEAAKAAAPYVHPRLAAVEHHGDVEKWRRQSLHVVFVDVTNRDRATATVVPPATTMPNRSVGKQESRTLTTAVRPAFVPAKLEVRKED